MGYRRRDVEEALDASAGALAEAQAAAASREEELRSRERELGWQRQQIDELDRVGTLLAERVVAHRKELDVLRAQLAERPEPSSDGAPTQGVRLRSVAAPPTSDGTVDPTTTPASTQNLDPNASVPAARDRASKA